MSTATFTISCSSSTPSTFTGNLRRVGLARTPAVAIGARRRRIILPQTKWSVPCRHPESWASSRGLTICAVMSNSRNNEHHHQQAVSEKLKLAVLIDGENAQAAVIEPLLAEVAKYGTASVKRIYADWTKLHNRPWKPNLLKHSIQPIQQFSYTSGKNATDSALIIDAMDLLHSGTMDGFCLVSSDSDFTRLASRLREDGLLVIGFGERKTPVPFVHSCDKFVYTEVLRNRRESSRGRNESSSGNGSNEGSSGSGGRGSEVMAPTRSPWGREQLLADSTLMWTLRTAIDDVTGESGWANLGLVGSVASTLTPEFDCRNYGYKRLGHLLSSMEPEVQMSGNRMFVRIDSSYDEGDDVLAPEEQGKEEGEEDEEEIGGQSSENVLGSEVVAANCSPWTREQLLNDRTLMWTLRTSIADLAAEDGWANLGHVGTRASILTPDFDCHSYGYKRLGQLLARMEPEVQMSGNRMYVRMDSGLNEATEAVQHLEQGTEQGEEEEVDVDDDNAAADDDGEEEEEEEDDGGGRSAADGQVSNAITPNCSRWTREQLLADSTLMWTLRTAIKDVAGEGGWANAGFVGRIASTLTPDFDCRNYGYKRLGHLLANMGPEVQMSENRNLVRIDSSFGEADGIEQLKDQKEVDEQRAEDEDEGKGGRGQEATDKPSTEAIKALIGAHDVTLNTDRGTDEKLGSEEVEEATQQAEQTIAEEMFYCI